MKNARVNGPLVIYCSKLLNTKLGTHLWQLSLRNFFVTLCEFPQNHLNKIILLFVCVLEAGRLPRTERVRQQQRHRQMEQRWRTDRLQGPGRPQRVRQSHHGIIRRGQN